jgi:hypothetical protein
LALIATRLISAVGSYDAMIAKDPVRIVERREVEVAWDHCGGGI